MYVSAHDMAFAHTQGHDRMFAWEGKGGGSCACASLGNSPEAKEESITRPHTSKDMETQNPEA
jgi:hypothetical protein